MHLRQNFLGSIFRQYSAQHLIEEPVPMNNITNYIQCIYFKVKENSICYMIYFVLQFFLYLSLQFLTCYDHPLSYFSQAWRRKCVSLLFITRTSQAEYSVDHFSNRSTE